MNNSNGNGHGNGFDAENLLGRIVEEGGIRRVRAEVIVKFSDFEAFVREIKANAHTDITKMILHIHPKYIDVSRQQDNTFKIIINIDKEDEDGRKE